MALLSQVYRKNQPQTSSIAGYFTLYLPHGPGRTSCRPSSRPYHGAAVRSGRGQDVMQVRNAAVLQDIRPGLGASSTNLSGTALKAELYIRRATGYYGSRGYHEMTSSNAARAHAVVVSVLTPAVGPLPLGSPGHIGWLTRRSI
jgi:hypothetical protein